MDLENYLNTIRKRLERSFDLVENYNINNYEIDLFGQFNMKTERYIVSKKAVIDTMENNEFLFIKYFKNLNKADLEFYINFLIENIDKLIEPSRDHMSSVITGVLVLDNRPDEEIIRAVEKFKYQKSFAFGFKGWVDTRLVLVIMKENHIITSKKGREVKEVYQI